MDPQNRGDRSSARIKTNPMIAPPNPTHNSDDAQIQNTASQWLYVEANSAAAIRAARGDRSNRSARGKKTATVKRYKRPCARRYPSGFEPNSRVSIQKTAR